MATAIGDFGALGDGSRVQAVRLAAHGLRATILTYGATVQDLRLTGVDWPLTLGAAELSAYLGPLRYAGAIVGPVANRIAGSAIEIAGQVFRLVANEGPNCLHGGPRGTSARNWSIAKAATDHVTLTLNLASMDDGLPGNRQLRATYRLLPASTIALDLTATTDAETLMNLAQHSYWTLDRNGTIAGQRLQVQADRYTPVDGAGLPTGTAAPVAGTGFDLRSGVRLAAVATFDHNFCLSDRRGPLRDIATLAGRSGVRLRLSSTEPGIQVYDGAKFPAAGIRDLAGTPIGPFAGVALEPQLWPDAPHHPQFPSARLSPGETYHQQWRAMFDVVPGTEAEPP